MHAHIDYITLGVIDVAEARRFYAEGLGWPIRTDHGEFVAFEPTDGSSAMAIFLRSSQARDAGLDKVGGNGYSGITFTYLVDSEHQVDAVLAEARLAGGTIVRSGKVAEWGGYFGYFADPDGYLWKVVVRQPQTGGHR